MVKLVIGVANFNKRYGIENKKFSKKNSYHDLVKILKKNKINIFDTSLDYKLDPLIAKKLNHNIKVITKIKLPEKKLVLFIKNLEKKIIFELKKLRLNKFEALLIHNVDDLKKRHTKIYLNKLMELKKRKLVKLIGVSVYQPSDLRTVYSKFKPDLIQFPLSFMNRSFLKNEIFNKLLKSKAKLQIRSVFLQGLMLKNYQELKKMRIKKQLKDQLIKFIKYCSKNEISQLKASIQFLKQLKKIDFINLGINNTTQLTKILNEFKLRKKLVLKTTNFDHKFLDPRKW